MRLFNFNFAKLAVLAVALGYMAAVPAKADIIAWSGSNCNGAEGGDVPCDGNCFDFTGRQSLEVRSFFEERPHPL